MALAWPGCSSAAPILFRVNPSYVTIGFSVRTLFGALSTTGEFKRFSGSILLDLGTPQRSHVDVTVDAASIDTGWDIANEALLSARYLDPAGHPAIRFVSDQVVAVAPDHVVLRGGLTIRGVTRVQSLDAVLKDERTVAGVGPVADFVVTGVFNRGDYGMVSDSPLVAMAVRIGITAHIRLTPVER